MMLRRYSPLVITLGVALTSCSDPADPPPQAAIYIEVGGASCNTQPPPYSLPSGPDAVQAIRTNGGVAPDGTTYRVVDGDKDVEVQCTVSPGADTITLNGRLAKSRSVSFNVRGDITTSGGTVQLSEWDNNRVATLSGECTLTNQHVSAGAIWANFTCPALTEGMNTCSANGVFVFENCNE
jgi:hypothetical protein